MNKSYIKQHYIPQFIIKNFCRSDGKVYYYDKKTKNVEHKLPKEIFEEENLYKYLFKNIKDSNIIEKDLGKFETEAAGFIKQFIDKDSIGLNYENNELLKYFFFIMMFRSKFMTASYNQDVFNHNKRTKLSANELDEFYKENLEKLLKHRSLGEVAEDKGISQQFIRYAISIVFGVTNKHFVLFESSEKFDFVLGDVYPIGLRQTINCFAQMPLSSLIFPISCKRAIALVDTYSEFHEKIKQFKISNMNWYLEPEKFGEGYLIRKKILTDELTLRANKAILDGSIDGICFRSDRKTGLSLIE